MKSHRNEEGEVVKTEVFLGEGLQHLTFLKEGDQVSLTLDGRGVTIKVDFDKGRFEELVKAVNKLGEPPPDHIDLYY